MQVYGNFIYRIMIIYEESQLNTDPAPNPAIYQVFAITLVKIILH